MLQSRGRDEQIWLRVVGQPVGEFGACSCISVLLDPEADLRQRNGADVQAIQF